MELDREDIIKGLECCDEGCCGDCPYLLADCKKELPKKALALINSKEQRIGELEAENEKLWEAIRHLAQIVVGAAVVDQNAKEMLEGKADGTGI